MGIGLGARVADDNFHPITDGIDEATIAGRQGDCQVVGIARLAKSERIAFRMGCQAATEVAMHGLLFGKVDAGRLAVETDTADAALFSENGATDFVISVGAGGGGGVGQAQGQLDPFVLHLEDYFSEKCSR